MDNLGEDNRDKSKRRTNKKGIGQAYSLSLRKYIDVEMNKDERGK